MSLPRNIKPQGVPPASDLPPAAPTITKEGTLSAADRALILGWRAGRWEDAAEKVGRLEHRDYAGTVVPFTLNFAQRQLIAEIERMLAFNVRLFADAARQGQDVPIRDLLGRLERGEQIFPWEIPLRLLIGKSRRRGMSALVEFLLFLRMNFVPNYPCVLMAHNEESAVEIGNYARNYWKRWPQEYRHLRFDAELNAAGRLQLRNDSRLEVFTAGSKAAEASRGWRFDFYHFSEYAHYKSYSESTACGAVAPPHAWMIKESTGNGPSGPFYHEWKRALTIDEAERAYNEGNYEKLSAWDGLPLKHQFKSFFSWLDDPGLNAPVLAWEADQYTPDKLDDYERAIHSRFPDKFTPGKIKWRRITIQQDCQDSALPPESFFAQEWPASPEEMFQATGTKVFSHYEALAISEALAEKEPPIVRARFDGLSAPSFSQLGGGNLHIYKLPEPGRSYLIGVDPKMGERDNKDEHALVVFDQHDGTFFEEVASFFDRLLDGHSMGHVATTLAEMYNRAFVTFEIQGGGLAVAKTIVSENGYSRVYERKTLDALDKNRGTDNMFRFGVFTSQQVKDLEVQTVRAILNEKRILFRSKKIIDQLRSFERVEGKYGGPEDELDDGVMAVLHGIFGGTSQGRPRRHAVADEVARAAELAADAMAPGLAAAFKAIAAKIAKDIAKHKGRRGTRPGLDTKSKRRAS